MGNNTTTYRGAGGQNSSSIVASLASVAAASHAASGKAAIPRRVDPRVSVAVLVLLNVTVFLAPLPIELAAAATGVAVMCWCGRFTSAARWSAAYALMLAGGYALVMAGEAFMPFAVSLTMLRRVMAVFMFGSNMVATTRTGELACGLQRLHVPRKTVCALCVMLRFFPTVAREFSAVLDAMKVRGMALAPKRIVAQPVQVMEQLIVPVVARVGLVADELASAACVRGIDAPGVRTSYYRLSLGAADVAVLAVYGALAVCAVLGAMGVVA